MPIIIRVSYQHPDDLSFVLKLLRPAVKSCKLAKQQKGPYKKAYVELNR